MKDSSSDVSPRESSTPTAIDQRRQRRTRQMSNDQQYDNQGYVQDERSLSPPIERADEEEEEQSIENAERLVSQVTKQHRRIVNEVKQSKKPKRKQTLDHAAKEQDNLNEQIREQQDLVSKHVANATVEQVPPVEPLPATIGTGRGRSLEQILEMARKSRATKNFDDG